MTTNPERELSNLIWEIQTEHLQRLGEIAEDLRSEADGTLAGKTPKVNRSTWFYDEYDMERSAELIVKDAAEKGKEWAEQQIGQAVEAGIPTFTTDVDWADHSDIYQESINDIQNRFKNITENLRTAGMAEEAVLMQQLKTYLGEGYPPDDALKATLSRLHIKGIPGMIDRSGRRWQPELYAQQAFREAHTKMFRNTQIATFVEAGYELVKVADTTDECKTCKPWEGKILSLATDAGENHNPSTKAHASIHDATKAGLFHPGCNHTVSLWIDDETNMITPPPRTEKERQLDREQRELEKQTREYRRKVTINDAAGFRNETYTYAEESSMGRLNRFANENTRQIGVIGHLVNRPQQSILAEVSDDLSDDEKAVAKWLFDQATPAGLEKVMEEQTFAWGRTRVSIQRSELGDESFEEISNWLETTGFRPTVIWGDPPTQVGYEKPWDDITIAKMTKEHEDILATMQKTVDADGYEHYLLPDTGDIWTERMEEYVKHIADQHSYTAHELSILRSKPIHIPDEDLLDITETILYGNGGTTTKWGETTFYMTKEHAVDEVAQQQLADRLLADGWELVHKPNATYKNASFVKEWDDTILQQKTAAAEKAASEATITMQKNGVQVYTQTGGTGVDPNLTAWLQKQHGESNVTITGNKIKIKPVKPQPAANKPKPEKKGLAPDREGMPPLTPQAETFRENVYTQLEAEKKLARKQKRPEDPIYFDYTECPEAAQKPACAIKPSETHEKGIMEYTHSSTKINDDLRDGIPYRNMDPKTQQTIRGLDTAIEDSNGLEVDTILWRGVDSTDHIPELKSGFGFADKGYTSTSFSKDVVEEMNGYREKDGWLLKIYARKGTKGVAVNNYPKASQWIEEEEFILPRDTSYAILEVDLEKRVITCTINQSGSTRYAQTN